MLPPATVISDLDHLLHLAAASETLLIQVLRTAKLVAGRSTTLRRDLGDRVIFKLQSIRSCVTAYLSMRFYRLGNRFLKQVGGVPIGGRLSGVLLRLCLSRRESAFEKFTWPKFSSHFKLPGPRATHLARHRYEDDLLLASTTICPLCLDTIVETTYRGCVPFGHTPDHEMLSTELATNKFLDLHISLGFVGTAADCRHQSIGLVNPNEEYTMSGDEALRAKQRFPPCIGTRQLITSRLTQNFQCRRARWLQASLSTTQMSRACGLDFADFLRCSYPPSIIRSAWFASRGHDPGYAVGLRALEWLPRHARGVLHSRISFSRRLAPLAPCLRDTFGVHLAIEDDDQLQHALTQLRDLLFAP